MTNNKKQVVFTNEIIYERNISDRIWPQFLDAQINKKLNEAWMSLKCYYLFTQQWYQNDSKAIATKIRLINVAITTPATVGELQIKAKQQAKAWVDIEDTWCEISNKLEDYGLFKRNYTEVKAKKTDESALQ